jgi:hypothetical protein
VIKFIVSGSADWSFHPVVRSSNHHPAAKKMPTKQLLKTITHAHTFANNKKRKKRTVNSRKLTGKPVASSTMSRTPASGFCSNSSTSRTTRAAADGGWRLYRHRGQSEGPSSLNRFFRRPGHLQGSGVVVAFPKKETSATDEDVFGAVKEERAP